MVKFVRFLLHRMRIAWSLQVHVMGILLENCIPCMVPSSVFNDSKDFHYFLPSMSLGLVVIAHSRKELVLSILKRSVIIRRQTLGLIQSASTLVPSLLEFTVVSSSSLAYFTPRLIYVSSLSTDVQVLCFPLISRPATLYPKR